MASVTYGTWWLTVDQMARVDTREAGGVELPLPLDGESIAQSFRVPEGGTDRACILLVNRRALPRRIVVQLQADVDASPGQVLSRAIRDVAPSSRVCVAVAVPSPTTQRAGTRWWIGLRALSAEASDGVHVIVTGHPPAMAAERLITGRRERWGTLALSVSAPASTRWRGAWPRGLYRPSSLAGVPALVTLVATIASSALVFYVSRCAATHASAMTAAVAVPVLLAGVHVASTWTPAADVRAYTGPGRALLDRLFDAEMRTEAASLGGGFAVITSDIREAGDRALFALPASAVSWVVSIESPTSLDTAVALRQEAWTHPGDGATFTVTVSMDGRTDVLWSGHINPYAAPDARRWHDVTVRLDRYVGRTVTLTLATSAGPAGNAVLDAAMWREPVLRRSVVR